MTDHRNVLYIVIDQLRADCLFGSLAGLVSTPHLNSLMANAVTFKRHYSVVNPCGPSRASLHTGQYAMNHRVVRNAAPLSANITNIALEARKVGYDPLLLGYTDTAQDPRQLHPNDPDLRSYERVLPGFNQILEMQMEDSYPWRAYLKRQGYRLPAHDDIYDAVSPDPHRAARLGDPTFYAAEHSDTAFLTQATMDAIAARQDQQWFIHATYLRPHPPYVAPAPYHRMYDPRKLPIPERLASRGQEAAVHPFCDALLEKTTLSKYVSGRGLQVDDNRDLDTQMIRAAYMALASEVDAQIGHVLNQLRHAGLYNNTLIVITSDHGDMLGDHHMWGKDTIYEPAWHIPLIIRDPAFPARHGTQVEAFSENIDVAPTILEWIGGKTPASMNGRSLLPWVRGHAPERWRDYVVHELDLADVEAPTVWQRRMGLTLHEANLTIIREKRYKLVHFNGGFPPLLFDMVEDPREMRNLADDPAMTETLLRLTQRLLDHRMRYGDHTLTDMKVTSRGVIGAK